MAALDFPATPALNDKYPQPAVSGVPVYTWDGAKWTTKGGAVGNTGASDDPPLPDTAAGEAGSSTLWSRGDHAHPQDPLKVDITGDTMTGDLTMAGDPTSALHAVTKQYVDNANTTLQDSVTDLEGDVATLETSKLDKTGGIVNGALTMVGAPNPEVHIYSEGQYAKLMMTVTGARSWTTGTLTNGVFAVTDESSGTLRYSISIDAVAAHNLFGNLFVSAGGYKPGGGTWADSSDARIKTVRGAYQAGLAQIAALQPKRYSFKGNDTDHAGVLDREFIGLVAQEAETVMPEMVTKKSGRIDGADVSDMRVLDTSALIFALVNAVKELKARVEQLEAA